MSSQYDAPIELYRGEIPKAVIKGLIQAESNWNPKTVNRAPDAPGGGPKVGLLQPSRAGLKDALDVDVVQEDFLRNPINNLRVGSTILNHYWQKLRREFPTGFARPLERDANAVAILVHAYTFGFEATAKLLREAGTTSWRELANRYPGDLGVQRRWPDRVLEAARKHGYTQILPAGALVPTPGAPAPRPPGGGGARPPLPGPSRSSPWPLVAALAGGVGLLYLATKKKRRA